MAEPRPDPAVRAGSGDVLGSEMGETRHAPTTSGASSPDAPAEAARFSEFAAALRAVEAAAGRLAKADALGAFLAMAPDADVARAARWAAGRAFALSDERSLGVGPAALRTATARASGAEPDALRAALVRLGDPGDVAAESLPRPGGALGERPPSELTLADVEHVLEALAAARGPKARTALVADALAAMGTDEARVFCRLLAGEMRTGLLEGGVESALARTFGADAAAVRRAHMLTGDLGETAVRARADTLAEAAFRPFHAVRFMLATAAEDAADVARQMEPPFLVEDKFDGIRAQAHVCFERPAETAPGADAPPRLHDEVVQTAAGPVRVALFSRTLDPIAGAFPDLLAPLASLAAQSPGGLVLDGEIVPVDARTGRIAPFQALQPRLGRKTPSAAALEAAPAAFVAYDALVADGALLLDAPFSERLGALEALGLPGADAPFRVSGETGRASTGRGVARSVVTPVASADDLDAAFDAARARGNEGLMVKRADALYVPGRRGRDWLKLKRALATLDVVVVSVEVGSGGRRHLLSDFTFAVRRSDTDPALLTVGKAYSGLTDAELADLTEWFKAHTRETFAHGRVRTVEPRVVLEVAFDRVQPSPRHKSGYALRFPRIVRLRPDKPPGEIDTLAAVAALADMP